MAKLQEPPEGIIVTVGAKILGDNGYKHWLKNFLEAMSEEGMYYHFRVGAQPKADSSLLYVYLCIGNRIRYRGYFAGSRPGGTLTLTNGKGYREVNGKAWILCAGPIERAPVKIEMKGFQGFRYTKKLW